MMRALAGLAAVCLIACLYVVPANAQEGQPAPEGDVARTDAVVVSGKQAVAVRVANGTINVDGLLDEAEWQSAPAISDFLQKEPNEGAPPSNRMEVRFVYDDAALYVGARMYSSDPTGIQAPLGRRDQVSGVAEHIRISLDTFLDRRTAYTFGVTASGVRLDQFHAQDTENGDDGFDPVWQAATRIDAQGWTAELWIPYTQLRFADIEEQVWGLNVVRFTPRLQEEVYWVVVPRTERGWASRFGELRGISGIEPTRRIEVMPFVVGSSTMNATRDRQDPFDDGRNLLARAGVDLKMGLGPNLTLDATLNPDFGQVEADPAEVNLTAFATRFPERRPFFTEGSDLLNLRHPNVFYSRRIGSPPVGRANGDFVDQPDNSSVLGAAKVTGRLPGGYSLGVLAALTAEEHARVFDLETQETSKVRVQPYAGYGVARLQKDLGTAGSSASVLVAGVRRHLSDDDELAPLVPENAIVYGGDALLRLRGGEYELAFAAVGSYVAGDAAAIRRVQMSSAHYFQRPDRDYAVLDPTLTSMAGFSTQASFNRVAGRHWLFGTSIKIDSPSYESNDIAQLTGADGIMPNWNVTYRETTPNRIFRSYSIRFNQGNEWNFGGDRQSGSMGTNVNLTWANFWTTSFQVTHNFRTQSATLTRGGPLMTTPRQWRGNLNIGNPSTSSTRISGGLSMSSDELGGWTRNINLNMSFRPTPRWQISAQPSYQRSRDSQQYVTTLTSGREETYGNRYIFAYIDRSTISAQIRASFTVRPDLNLDVYMEPFAASGRYFDYGELREPRSIERIKYGEDGTTLVPQADGTSIVTAHGSTFELSNRDFNVRSFNSNAVLRWEWRPGSTMYLVWQQSRSARETIDTPVGFGDPFRAITTPGTNILLFKTSWWLPVG